MIQTYWSCLTVEVKGIGITFKKNLRWTIVMFWSEGQITFEAFFSSLTLILVECSESRIAQIQRNFCRIFHFSRLSENISLLPTFWEYFTSLDFLQNLSLLLTFWEYFTSLNFLRIFFFSQHPEDLSHQHYEDPSLNINMWISVFNFLRIFLFSLLSKCFGFFI